MTSFTPPSSRPGRVRSVPPPAGNVLSRELLASHRQASEGRFEAKVARPQNSPPRGGNWFYWVAGLSVVNSIISLSGGRVTFLPGLAVTQLADGYARHLGFVGPYFNLGIALVVAVFVCGFGHLSSCGSLAALIVGMGLYALDGLIFLLFSAYLSALFHGFVLFQMAQDWQARRRLERSQSVPVEFAAPHPPTVEPVG